MGRAFPFDQDEFRWRDGERMVVFGAGALEAAPATLAEHGWAEYELLSTPRALAAAPPALAANAATVHEVAAGQVPQISLEILERVASTDIVAHGGGRVIDSAKAVAAVAGDRVCAIPTTLSGAPMTVIHRLPEGHQAPGLHRPPLVIADPVAMTGQPERERRASAMNALAHGADSLYTPLANPLSRLAALNGARLIAKALDDAAAERSRADLSLGALLCAYSIDSALFSLHHVICQTLVRVLETPHAETNAAILPHSLEALRSRAPEAIAALANSLDTTPEQIAPRVEQLAGGAHHLSDLGAKEPQLDNALDQILQRPELQMTPDPPTRIELKRIITNAW